jgi:DNA-binding MarR family transcriptional regulator
MQAATLASDVDLEMVGRLRLAVARLSRRLRQEGSADVTPSQYSALATIESRGPLTLGELAAIERVQPPTMTRIVANLEESGLVARTVDPQDRRVARVQVTPSGRKLIDRSRTRRNAWIAARLRRLPAEDRAALTRTVELLEHLLDDRQ